MCENRFLIRKFGRKRQQCKIDFGLINEIGLNDCKVIKRQKTLYIQGNAYNARRLLINLYIVFCLQIIILCLWIYKHFM